MDPVQNPLIEIDLSKLADTTMQTASDIYSVTSSPITISAPYTWNSQGTSPSWTYSDLSIESPPQSKISLTGDNADIEINGESVVGMLREIRDRLNILRVSEDMEQEWDELRILREQYEAKLAECREKSSIWKALKDEN